MPIKPPKTCMFCGGSPVTKAHVFAESWTKLFDDPYDTREHRVVHTYKNPYTGKSEVIKKAQTFALVTRKVCGLCNSGWLRKAEEEVLPLMAKFADGQPLTLGQEEQVRLALWATATALIAMARDPEAKDFASPSLAQEFFELARPPAGIDIWIGANTHGEMGQIASHSLTIPKSSDPQHAWGATIMFGFVVVHVVCHGVQDERLCLRGQANRSLRRIWTPRHPVRWPPPSAVPDDSRWIPILLGNHSSFQRAVHSPLRAVPMV